MECVHHHQDAYTNCKPNTEKVHTENQLDAAKLKCKLCDVLKNQSHFYDVSAAFTFVLYADDTIEKSFVYIDKHPVAFILSAANKGPPILTA